MRYLMGCCVFFKNKDTRAMPVDAALLYHCRVSTGIFLLGFDFAFVYFV